MNDKIRHNLLRNWFLFLIILPICIAVVAPFFIILKIALIPEGLSASDHRTFVIRPAAQSAQNRSTWDVHNGSMEKSIERLYHEKFVSVTWRFEGDDSFLYWSQPFKQNLRNFDHLSLDITTTAPSFVIGFTDVNNHNVVTKFSISAPVTNNELIIPMNSFDLSKVDTSNIKNVFILITEPVSGTVTIEKLRFTYALFTLSNFKDVLSTAFFGRYFINSAFISIMVMLGNIIFSTMAGFAFASRSFPLRRTFFIATVLMIMIPIQVLMIPTFILIQNLGWLNSYKALIIPFLISPINIFIMKQYISKLPQDFAEAALVDGASYYTIFFRIILPMCKPAIAVVGINTFVSCWNSFLYPFILTNTAHMRTLPVGLALYIGLFDLDWSHLMAASSLSALPVLVVFFCFQNQIIEGMLYGRAHHI